MKMTERINVQMDKTMLAKVAKLAAKLSKKHGVEHTLPDAIRWAIGEAKWTKGPYELRDNGFRILKVCGNQHLVAEVVAPEQEVGVCLVILPDEDDTQEQREERLATATFIAAAPAMYALLEEFPMLLGKANTAFGLQVQEWQEKALQVMAQARGEL